MSSMSSPTNNNTGSSNNTNGSLTPLNRSEETVQAANTEGLMNGLLILLPSIATVTLLVRNNVTFAQRTNLQSRTAMAIMPALFISALTSEQQLSYKMRQMAIESQHGTETVQWAEQQLTAQQQLQQQQSTQPLFQPISTIHNTNTTTEVATTQQLASLYQQSVESSGVCIVPNLQWYHHVANYTCQYPFRVLSAIAIPSVAYIFYGRTEQQHLQFSQKLMHTRVLGQFATISLLLTVMGFKEYMDQNGKYISQQQADDRIHEMHRVRQQFLMKIEQDKQHAAELQAEIDKAHDEDTVINKKKKQQQNKKNKAESSEHDDK